MALRAVMLLAVCLAAVAAAEGPSGSSLYETIQSSRSGASARISAASYYLGTKKSCLLLKQIESCRVLGGDVNPGSIPDPSGPIQQQPNIAGGYFETSLGCCDEHTDYERPQDLSNLARSDKVAGCEWSFNLLKDSSGNNETLDMLPVKGKSWIKFGPASAICSFNDNSGKCHGPFCDGMTITMQGAMYAALAYSTEGSNTLSAPPSDLCEPVASIFNTANSVSRAGQRAPNKRMESSSALSSSEILWESINQVALNELGALLAATWGPPAPPSDSAPKHGLYGGSALVFMGQVTISTMKGGLRVEETGHIEFTPAFSAYRQGVTLDQDFVMVKGGGMKIWTTEQERHSS